MSSTSSASTSSVERKLVASLLSWVPSDFESGDELFLALKDCLRRRDNLSYFVDGLVRTEIYPYPSGQLVAQAAMSVAYQEVRIRPDKLHELLTLELTDAQYHIEGEIKLADMTISLSPEDGVGAYTLEVHNIREIPRIEARGPDTEVYDSHRLQNLPTRLLTEPHVEQLRLALWSRYDWVTDKVNYINDLRQGLDDHNRPFFDPQEEDADLSEEAELWESDCDSMSSDDEPDDFEYFAIPQSPIQKDLPPESRTLSLVTPELERLTGQAQRIMPWMLSSPTFVGSPGIKHTASQKSLATSRKRPGEPAEKNVEPQRKFERIGLALETAASLLPILGTGKENNKAFKEAVAKVWSFAQSLEDSDAHPYWTLANTYTVSRDKSPSLEL
ncbi:hypothetical protein H2203_003758 [Taxawa tesnikishii (nom. ined.)]|nr:hypothetical protein H2203_003758 [Dothideales sp. JES 119]